MKNMFGLKKQNIVCTFLYQNISHISGFVFLTYKVIIYSLLFYKKFDQEVSIFPPNFNIDIVPDNQIWFVENFVKLYTNHKNSDSGETNEMFQYYMYIEDFLHRELLMLSSNLTKLLLWIWSGRWLQY